MNAKVTSEEQPPDSVDATQVEPRWTFLSNHTHVLLCLAMDAEQRVRDVAESVGLTEPLRHPLEERHTVGELLALLLPDDRGGRKVG